MNKGGGSDESIPSFSYRVQFFCCKHDIGGKICREEATGGKKSAAPSREAIRQVYHPSVVSLRYFNESYRRDVDNGFTSIGLPE
jgi:hypothetical protein